MSCISATAGFVPYWLVGAAVRRPASRRLHPRYPGCENVEAEATLADLSCLEALALAAVQAASAHDTIVYIN